MTNCPKCNSVTHNIAPTKSATPVYGCPTCGYVCHPNGEPVVTNPQQLANIFRVATEGQKTLQEVFGQAQMDPATKAILITKLVEYGTQMWFDGLKQGILLGTVQEMKK